jgi:hypothetical protein
MSRNRRLLLLSGVLIVAAVLALPLRETVYDMVLIPAAFLGFQLGLLYRSFSQAIWWWLIITVVIFMLALSLIPELRSNRRKAVKAQPRLGQVEELAVWLRRGKGGTYFKWLVANRLGKLAHQMLLHRESGHPRSVFAPLAGTDWKPSKELQTYLEIGLRGSFADFPHTASRFAAPLKTPLDYEVSQAVEFLESQLEDQEV